MKNTIPLVAAVVLGLLAVFAVSRTLSKNGSSQYGKEITVLVANGNLKSGTVISAENFNNCLYNINIRSLVMTADIIDLAERDIMNEFGLITIFAILF